MKIPGQMDEINEIIGITVIIAGTICALYITYITKQIPEFFSMGFGIVLAYYFNKAKQGK